MNATTYKISQRMIALAAKAIQLAEPLSQHPAGRKLADQLVRSVTSIGANFEEAHGTHTRADFSHKMQIALKEAREACYWLLVAKEAGLVSERIEPLVDEALQIRAILGKAVSTVRRNAKLRRT